MTTTPLFPLSRAFASLVATAGLACAQAPSWDASAEFSSTQNSNGVWSYGWSLNRGAPLNPFNQSNIAFCGPLTGWSNQFPQFPAIAKNESSATMCCTSIRVPPGAVVLHPGQAGENAVLRWTAPHDGYFWVEVDFGGADFSFPTNSDVAVLHNLSPLFSSQLNAFSGPPTCTSTQMAPIVSFAQVVQCLAGDTIDCNAGFGQGQRYNGDSTFVSFKLTQVTTAESFGTPCGGSVNMRLGTGLPFLGMPMNVGLSFAATNSFGLVALGDGAPAPSAFLGCTLYPSLPAFDVVYLTTNGLGQWQTSLPIPAGTQLHGYQFTMQALVINPTAPQQVEFSNAMVLTL